MPLDAPHLDDSADFATMSFGDHLEELRSRVIRALLFPVPIAFVSWFFSTDLVNLICLPLQRALRRADLDDRLQVLAPVEALMTQIKISLLAAAVVSAPWILWQLWLFVRPGLYRRERRFVYFLIPGSAILTVAGVALLYFGMLPLVLTVLVQFGVRLDENLSFDRLREGAVEIDRSQITKLPVFAKLPANAEVGDMWLGIDHALYIVVPELGYDPANPPLDDDGLPIPPQLELRRIPLHKSAALVQQFQLTSYINFVLLLTLGMVIGFQTPLVVLLLGWLDLVRIDFLKKNRKYAFFICAILGAVLTPADPWSMIAMMVPLYLLFELGILLLTFFPASKVAEGEVFARPRRRASEKRSTHPSHSAQSEQSQRADRPSAPAQSESADQPDDQGGSP